MKSFLRLAILATFVGFVACGPSAEEQAKLQATADSLKQDSIAKVEQRKSDSIAAIEKVKQDSIAAVMQKAKDDSIAAAAKGGKKKGK